MFKAIPWDVWLAATVAVVAALAMIFEPAPAIFIVVYLCLCAYIVVKIIW
jgi:hypothetical protein